MKVFEETYEGRHKTDDRIILMLTPKEARQLYEMSKAMTEAHPRKSTWKTWHRNFYENLPF